MTATKIQLRINSFQQRTNYYLNKQNCDLYLVIQDRLYPVHKRFIAQSKYLVEQYSNMQSIICFIDKPLDILYFEKILSFLYGRTITCKRDWEIVKLLQIAELMRTQLLTEILFQDIERNSDDYCIFVLYTIAHKFNAKWLKQICMERFLQMEFEQINYKRYKFVQCQKIIAEQMISFAIKFHKQRKHYFDFRLFKQIINLYNRQSQNKQKIDINILFVLTQDIINETSSECQKSSVNSNKKYKIGLKTNISTENTQNQRTKISSFQIDQMDQQSLQSNSLYDSKSRQNNSYSNHISHQEQKRSIIASFLYRKLTSSLGSYATPSNLDRFEQQIFSKSASLQKQIYQNPPNLKDLPSFGYKKQTKIKRMNTINFPISQQYKLKKQTQSIFSFDSIL